MAKRLMWTTAQREVADLYAQGLSFQELVDRGCSKTMASRVGQALKVGNSPPPLTAGQTGAAKSRSASASGGIIPEASLVSTLSAEEVEELPLPTDEPGETEEHLEDISGEEAWRRLDRGEEVPGPAVQPVPVAVVASVEEEEHSDQAGGQTESGGAALPPDGTQSKPGVVDGQKTAVRVIPGQGLTFAVTLSPKTYALYHVAQSYQERPLLMGDFLDVCVEDFFLGRGKDLGLVNLGGNGHGR